MSDFSGPHHSQFSAFGACVGFAAGVACVDILRAASFASARSRVDRSLRHLDAMAAHRDAIISDAARLNAEADDILASLLD